MSEMRERVARALCRYIYEDNTNDCNSHVEAFWTDEVGAAERAISCMQIPTNRMVAAAADELGMDATKVAAVWMIMMRTALGGDDGK